MNSEYYTVRKLKTGIVLFLLCFNISFVVFSQTPISGSIKKDTKLLLDHSPYLITGPVKIDIDATLEIEPGVVIINKGSYKIEVKGKLRAIGMLAAPILFKLGEGRLAFLNAERGSEISHCVFEGVENSEVSVIISSTSKLLLENFEVTGSEIGVWIKDGAKPTIINGVFSNLDVAVLSQNSDPVIQNTLIEFSKKGLVLENGQVNLKGCLFESCDTAVLFRGGAHKIEQNKFIGCGAAINLSESFDELQLEDNSFYNTNNQFEVSSFGNISSLNTLPGDLVLGINSISDTVVLYPLNGDRSYVLDRTFEVKETGVLILKPGVCLKFAPKAYIKVFGQLNALGLDTGNIVFEPVNIGQNGGGIHFLSEHKPSVVEHVKMLGYEGFAKTAITVGGNAKIEIKECTISGGYCAVWVTNGARPLISQNNLLGNGIGIYLSSGRPELRGNVISGNKKYGLINQSNELLPVRSNFWGDGSGPYHQRINSKGVGNLVKGNVLLNPWLSVRPEEMEANVSIVKVALQKRDSLILSGITINIKNEARYILKSCAVSVWINDSLVEQFDWLGHLLPNTEEKIDLDKHVFDNEKPYRVAVQLSYPNGIDDLDEGNNHSELIINDDSEKVYSVGGFLAHFETISAALKALKTDGLGNVVVFEIEDGVYNEGISIKAARDFGLAKTVIFRSKSGDRNKVIIAGDKAAGNVVELDRVSSILFEHITFKGLNIEGVDVFVVGTETENVTISNCLFEGKRDTGVVFQCLGKEITLSNSTVIGGSTGVFCYGVTDDPIKEIKLLNNDFSKQKELAVGLRYLNKPIVDGNTITSSNEAFTGIDLRECAGFLVKHNKVVLKADGTGVSIFEGKNLENNAAISFNEIVVDGLDIAFATGFEVSQYIGKIEVFNNSVKVGGENTSSTAVFVENGQKVELSHNIFSNYGAGYALFIGNSNNSTEEVFIEQIAANHNNYFTKGDRLIGAGADYSKLWEWQLSTGLDKKSFAVNPKFESSYSLVPRQDILTLLNGENQKDEVVEPYIGAVKVVGSGEIDLEVSSILEPVSGCYSDKVVPLLVRIKNRGNVEVSGFKILLKDNNKLVMDEYVGHVSLKPGQEITYESYNQIDVSRLGNHDLAVEIEHPADKDLSKNQIKSKIELKEELSIDVECVTEVCNGERVNIKAYGADSYVWSNGQEKQSIRVKIDHDTVFWVEGIDDNNCRGKKVVSVSLKDPSTHLRDVSICKGDSAYLGGMYRFDEGVYRDTFSTNSGCDSVVVTQLKLRPELDRSPDRLYFKVCSNSLPQNLGEITSSVITYKGKGVEQNVFYPAKVKRGIYTLIKKESGNSCLGLDTLVFEVLDEVKVNYDTYIQEGDSIWLSNQYRFNGGVFIDTMESVNGCDSIVVTNLEIIEKSKIDKNRENELPKKKRSEIEKISSDFEED